MAAKEANYDIPKDYDKNAVIFYTHKATEEANTIKKTMPSVLKSVPSSDDIFKGNSLKDFADSMRHANGIHKGLINGTSNGHSDGSNGVSNGNGNHH